MLMKNNKRTQNTPTRPIAASIRASKNNEEVELKCVIPSAKAYANINPPNLKPIDQQEL